MPPGAAAAVSPLFRRHLLLLGTVREHMQNQCSSRSEKRCREAQMPPAAVRASAHRRRLKFCRPILYARRAKASMSLFLSPRLRRENVAHAMFAPEMQP